MRVYVAGSSAEIERVERFERAIEAAGFKVVSTWRATVAGQGGAGNPRGGSNGARG